MRNIIVILMREEICNTEAFDIFLKELFVPRFKMMVELVEIASRGRLKGEDARIATRMLFGLTHLFNTARTGIAHAQLPLQSGCGAYLVQHHKPCGILEQRVEVLHVHQVT